MTTSRDPANPEEKKPVEQPGTQKVLDDLTVVLDEEKIQLFSNPRFLDVLKKQYEKRYQGEFLGFLQEVYDLNQKNLKPEKLEQEIDRLLATYINVNGEKFVNIADTLSKSVYAASEEARKRGEALTITIFEPAIQEVNSLINKNLWGTAGRLGDIAKQNAPALLAAYEQDKISQGKSMVPIRTVICHALQEIENREPPTPIPKMKRLGTLLKITKNTMTPADRANTFMEMIEGELKKLLADSAKPDANPEALQKIFQHVINSNLKQLSSVQHMEKVDAIVKILGGAVYENDQLTMKKNDPAVLATLVTPANTALIQKYMTPIEEKQMQEKEAVKTASSLPRLKTGG